MRLHGLSVDSFGGVRDLSLRFDPGLNVILGPNEAGKSTVFHVVRNVLLTRARLNKRDMDRSMSRYFPVGGGDSIAATVEMDVGGGRYLLRKRWGAQPEARLTLPDGTAFSNEDEIESRLETLLPAGPGTMRSVFLMRQSGLSSTLDELTADTQTVQSLGDLLRRSMFETGGVSVERFRAELERQYDLFCGRWDLHRGRPEGGRGVATPWKQGAGLVVNAWYRMEGARRRLAEIRVVETEIEELQHSITAVREEIRSALAFLGDHGKAYQDAGRRALLSEQLRGAETELAAVVKAQTRWPALEEKLRYAAERIRDLSERQGRLEKEEALAEAHERNRKLLEHFGRVKKRKEQLDAADERLTRLRPVTRKDAAEARELAAEAALVEGELDAGTLGVTVEASKGGRIRVSAGRHEPEEIELPAGGRHEIVAGGQASVEIAGFRVTVQSGEGDRDALERRRAELRERLTEAFERHSVHSVGEAESSAESYEAAVSERSRAAKALEEELGEHSWENLVGEVQETGSPERARELSIVRKELGDVQRRLDAAERDRDEANTGIAELCESYGDSGSLVLKLASAAGTKERLKTELDACAPLPAGFRSSEELRKAYERCGRELEDQRKRQSTFELEMVRAEGRLPSESGEETEQLVEEAEREYAAVERKAKALSRVKERTEMLLGEQDTAVYRELHGVFHGYLSRFTGERYGAALGREGVPRSVVRAQGGELPFELLSGGIKDAFALCLRLAMARFFLRGEEGFLLLDDPLVDMDPERRAAAVELLSEETANLQILLFTCHPSHAEAFGSGRLIEL